MCELSSAPGRLRAIRRKSSASIDASPGRTRVIRLDHLTFGCLTAQQKRLRKRAKPTKVGDADRPGARSVDQVLANASRQIVPSLDLRHQSPKIMRPI